MKFVFVGCLLTFLGANVQLSESKGNAAISVLMPHHAFFTRKYKASVYRSINAIKQSSGTKTLSRKYNVVGAIDFTRGPHEVKKIFCNQLNKSHPSAFLYMPLDKTADMKKYILKRASDQQIPLILWDRTGTASVKWQGLVLHMLPTVEQMADAGADLVKTFGWKRLAVIHDNSSGADEFVTELKKKSSRVIRHRTDDPRNLMRVLFGLKVAKTQAVFLYVENISRAATIFKIASKMHMTGKSPAWILSNLAVPKGSTTPVEYPIGLIGLQVAKGSLDAVEAINVALKNIWAPGLEHLLRKKNHPPRGLFRSNGTCAKPLEFSSGKNIYSEMSAHGTSDQTGRVGFNPDGTSNELIRITNFNSERKWVKIGYWSTSGGLKLLLITGPGGVKLPASCSSN